MILAEVAAAEPSAAMEILWVALPYTVIATMITGLIWRYRYDKFGWTTRSSQALREASAAHRLAAVSLRHARGHRGPCDRPHDSRVLDRSHGHQ
ncbi:respiratory nitrate reductase subunit gamma [Demequina litorisediminis]|uniref:NarG-like domain-containing protein n=1 Tax=Demequina litorisediminis TaxID=1849022 RepID=A0ABQ6I8V2_9MICO|nr:hypothetical protein GCM10025876_04610 [Demequina litorisediminis]